MLLLYLLFLPLLKSAIADNENYNKNIVYAVEGNTENIQRLIKQFRDTDIPYSYFSKSGAKLIVPPNLDKRFSNAVAGYNLTKEVLIEDYGEFIRIENSNSSLRSSESFSWSAYYALEDIHNYLRDMAKAHKEATLSIPGPSYEGRLNIGLRINTSSTPKQKVVIESGIHAREWITPAATTYFINQLLTSKDPTIVSLKNRFEWYIYPVLNPDGYYYSFTTDRLWRKSRTKEWHKNCVGVDINRNWDYHWGQYDTSTNPCDETYGGPEPFSEAESYGFSGFLKTIEKNMLAYIAFHSADEMLFIPYSDSKDHVDNYDDLDCFWSTLRRSDDNCSVLKLETSSKHLEWVANPGLKSTDADDATGKYDWMMSFAMKIGKAALKHGEKVSGVPYAALGTIEKIFNPASGLSMDWVRQKLNTPLVYTFELRGSELPFHWPPDRIAEQGEEVTRMLVGLFNEACNLGYCKV